MRRIRYILSWLKKTFFSDTDFQIGIDSHRWESKIEIYGHCLGCHH